MSGVEPALEELERRAAQLGLSVQVLECPPSAPDSGDGPYVLADASTGEPRGEGMDIESLDHVLGIIEAETAS